MRFVQLQPFYTADYTNRDNKLKASGRMDFTHEDRADPRKLNVILWHDAMGDAAVPGMILHPRDAHHDDDDD